MSYKIIACDLDETLLNPDHREISPRNREAVRKAREKGVKFVPTTGRGITSVQPILQKLNLYNEPDEYVISCNGGTITENRGNRVLHFNGLSFEQADALFKHGLSYDVRVHVYTQDGMYIYGQLYNELEYLRERPEITMLKEPSIEFLRTTPISKMLFSGSSRDYLRQIEQDLSNVTQNMEVSYSSHSIEFNAKGVSKGSGLLRLAELLGVDPKDTIAIGDNINDRTMIRAAGLGVGVRNATEEIRPDCDYITQATHDQDAVAEVIEKFVL